MSERTDGDYLLHITEAIFRTISYTEDMTYEGFIQDTKTHDKAWGFSSIGWPSATVVNISRWGRSPSIAWRLLNRMWKNEYD